MIFELREKANFLQIKTLELMFPESQTEYDRNFISTS